MIVEKITSGFVMQVFNSQGDLLDQHFHPDHESKWEDTEGNEIEPCGFKKPYVMVHPEVVKDLKREVEEEIDNERKLRLQAIIYRLEHE